MTSLDKLRQAMNTATSGGTQQKSYDEDMWKPEMDKSGNGYAVVRFLPAPEGEEMPWVQYFDHGFQGQGGWYIEKSLTTIGKQDPVSEYNSQLWNTGIEANKDQARKQKRRLHYVANVLVVSDPKNPENEGKVFKYRFGKKIFEMLKEAISPQFEDEKPINPFDPYEGANFKIKIRKVDGYWNYDKSEFDSPAAIGSDDEINKVYSQVHSLSEVIAPDQFKTYDELKEKLDRVLGLSGNVAPRSTAESVADDMEEVPWNNVNTAPVAESTQPAVAETPVTASVGEEEDAMDYFKRLAND